MLHPVSPIQYWYKQLVIEIGWLAKSYCQQIERRCQTFLASSQVLTSCSSRVKKELTNKDRARIHLFLSESREYFIPSQTNVLWFVPRIWSVLGASQWESHSQQATLAWAEIRWEVKKNISMPHISVSNFILNFIEVESCQYGAQEGMESCLNGLGHWVPWPQ